MDTFARACLSVGDRGASGTRAGLSDHLRETALKATVTFVFVF